MKRKKSVRSVAASIAALGVLSDVGVVESEDYDAAVMTGEPSIEDEGAGAAHMNKTPRIARISTDS